MQLSSSENKSSMMIESKSIFSLKGVVQYYSWGGFQFIPNLIGIANNEEQHFAELWMGTHQRGPAILELDEGEQYLTEFIQSAPETVLGKRVAEQFDNKLPFLFKVLDVNQMLSIQSHPTKERAIEGYRAENDQNIPLSAPHRVYKDDNHKPEIMVALTDFWLLHGFKSEEAINAILNEVSEFKELLFIFEKTNTFQLYKEIMEWPQEKVDTILDPLGKRLGTMLKKGILGPNHPDYWAALAFRDMQSASGGHDRGIFSIYLFNLVTLKAGQAIFQDAGIPHAYLRGINIELMANSDNVFRGGLTKKHIDVQELLANLDFSPIKPNIIEGTLISQMEKVFSSPAPDFELRSITIPTNECYSNDGEDTPAILILIEGKVSINSTEDFSKGQIVFVPALSSYKIRAKEEALFFKAIVPKLLQ